MEYFGKRLLIKNKHLYWENGDPFFLLADTQWYGLTKRCSIPVFKKILADRKEKGFTAIQLVVGTPPETTIFNENAQSTNGHFIFNQDYSINQAYFDDIDEKIKLVVEHKLVPILYGSWGHYMDITGPEPQIHMWNEIVKRYSGFPVIYSLCGEADLQLPVGKAPLLKRILNRLPLLKQIVKKVSSQIHQGTSTDRLSKWQEVGNHLKQINLHGHPITVHLQSARLSTDVFSDPSFITLNGFQSGHSIDGFETMKRLFTKAKSADRPVINLEPLYEGILDQFDTRLQNYAFYISLFSDACGHCYGAHGLWQMASGDNFMKHWGNSTWKNALNYQGGKAIGAAKMYFDTNTFKYDHLTTISDVTIQSTETKMPPLTGKADKDIYMYLPYPQKITSLELHVPGKINIYDACTFQKINESSELDMRTIQKHHLELFIHINIV